MRFEIDYQITEALPSLVAGAAVMDIAERALGGMGTGIIDRQQEQGEPWVHGEPVLHRFGLMELKVVDHHGEAGGPGAWRNTNRGQHAAVGTVR